MAGTSQIHDATLHPSKLALLTGFLPEQRWYVGKDHAPQLERVGAYRFEDPTGEVGIETHLVRDVAATPPVLYQVPLTYRAQPLDGAEHALVGTVEHSVLGTRYVYDAPHDPVYVAELLRTVVEADTESTPSRGAHDTHVVGEPVPGTRAVAVRSARVLSGEQSNTSIIVEADAGIAGPARPVIVKVFRVLHAGDNPDVTVQSALAGAGSTLVPAPLGALAGTWGDGVRGHLAFVQEFLPGVQDAWRVALAAIDSGTDFADRARALGVATGEVHRDLAATMETKAAEQVDRDGLLASMKSRYVLAAEAHPALRDDEDAIMAVLTAAQDVPWPTLQRIHGDYHLGQVLDAPGRGWVLLDFEGEPLRPLVERSLPDLPQRDVAGMLRSFDYAAGQHERNGGDAASGRQWAARARDAFLDGYAQATGTDPRTDSPELLAALELDKALYEIQYEARNRPDWIAIPAGAIARLAGSTAGSGRARSTDTPADGGPTAPAATRTAAGTPDADAAPTPAPAGRKERTTVNRTPQDDPTPAEPQRTERVEATEVVAPRGTDRVEQTETVETVQAAEVVEAAQPQRDVEETRTQALEEAPVAPVERTTAAPAAEPAPAATPAPRTETRAQSTDATTTAGSHRAQTGSVAATLKAAAGKVSEAVHGAVESATSGVATAAAKAGPTASAVAAKASDAASTTAAKAGDAVSVASQKAAPAASAVAAKATEATAAASTPALTATEKAATKVAESQAARAARPLPVHTDEINRLVAGHHHSPHSILGPHPADGALTVRVLAPGAAAVRLHLADDEVRDLEHEHGGVWVVALPGEQVRDYRVGIDWGDGFEHVADDPYRFLPTVGEMDQHLMGEGRHERLWEVLGSHLRSYDGPLGTTTGTSFAVWAPNAVAVRVAGDFNQWNSQRHPMRSMGSSGVWELFVPDVAAGTRYKYEIFTTDGQWIAKADPMARGTEIPPATASVVVDDTFEWHDDEWVARREATKAHEAPMSIYEVHLGSWRQGLGYEELADQLVNYVKDLGFTHVEFLPVAEHPYGPSWGYQVTGYYAPTSRFGSPAQFRHLVDTLHANGIGVILDWVPAHFPKDAFALAKFDGQALYEHPDPRRGDQPDWGTHVFDFGRPQVRNFLVANALYWLEEFHIDGLRVDAVASMLYLDYSRQDGEWLPNEFGGREHLEAVQFLQETNATVYKHHPGALMIAEESTSWPGVSRPTHVGGLGFGFKWNMGWMHDTLAYMEHEPVHRQYHHHQMTFGLVYAFSENFVLPISHDEVVYGKGSLLRKMPGDRWQQLANLRAYLGFMWAHPGKQLLFMGQEFAQEAEWADGASLDWWLLDQPAHLGVHQMVKAMNAAYQDAPALWQRDIDPSGFAWIDANDAQGNVFSFMRYGAKVDGGTAPALACVSNFSGAPHHQYRIGLPEGGTWNEVLNTDATEWGGSGVGNLGAVHAEPIPWHGMPFSGEITVPPLATVWFTPADGTARRGDHVLRQERPELAAAAQEQAEAGAAADAADRPELQA